ncbi:MAG: PTS fructose transporter subunit IIA [Acholeplasmatales bacterium]|nr:MAG: PTS fructose transporter subunit IIA [Acholeplasmatales bacterium]
MSKITAYCIHHTHWDPIWYFSAEEAMIQFTYNMKELFARLEDGRVDDFFLDGQTAAIEDYVRLHPEDIPTLHTLIKAETLFIGPFHSQLDCFISSGEAILNNLRLGMAFAKRLGGCSQIAYLPDSFGHSADFPKIFNLFGIKDFVITRGVGDPYGLKSEFYFESPDGSRLLVHAMLAGYGYGTYGFRDGTLLDGDAEDYNKLPVEQLIKRLRTYTTLKDAFVFPIGFDQNPVILDIKAKIEQLNAKQDRYMFVSTTWQAFMDTVRANGQSLKTYRGELMSTQYHRMHRSLFSVRADIKTLQDAVERQLTYEVQPLMTMLDAIGIPYNQALLDDAWETLIRTQTHASATMTDSSNAANKAQVLSALQKTMAMKVYLMKLPAISMQKTAQVMPLCLYHTIPEKQTIVRTYTLYTKHAAFTLKKEDTIIPYVLLNQTRKSGGVIRRDRALMDARNDYYETVIAFEHTMPGLSYETVHVHDGLTTETLPTHHGGQMIENAFIRIAVDEGITLFDKQTGHTFKQALYLELSGDAGDNYDYSPPEIDQISRDAFTRATVTACVQSAVTSRITLETTCRIPKDLQERAAAQTSATLFISLSLTLKKHDPVVHIEGRINHQAENHRVRLVVKTHGPNTVSYAGTQYGVIARPCVPEALSNWREKGYFEAPTPHYPLLNHVSAVHPSGVTTVHTRSAKEYELIGPAYQDIALTLFRSVGHLGLPDLTRRPGRPSGLADKIFPTPDSQMKDAVTFAVGLAYAQTYNSNAIAKQTVRYASDLLYYQHQTYNTTVFTMAYFPTNPLPFPIPSAYCHLAIESNEAVFGSLVKSADQSADILRLYNTRDTVVPYHLKGRFARGSLTEIDMHEQLRGPSQANDQLLKHQLKLIKLTPKPCVFKH